MHKYQPLSPSHSCASRIKGGIRYIYHPTTDGRSIRAWPQPSTRLMSLMPALNSSRQPHQHDRPPSERRDPLHGLHRGDTVTTISTDQQARPEVADPARPGPPRPPDSSAHTGSDRLPDWERLIRSSHATHERISLIANIFSNQGEVEIVRDLCGDDAQIFIDMIHEACSYILSPSRNGASDFGSNLSICQADVG